MLVQEHRYNDETFLTGEGSLSYKNNALKNLLDLILNVLYKLMKPLILSVDSTLLILTH